MSSLSCGVFWGEGKPGPGDPEWGGTKGKVRAGIWSVETNPFYLREWWGVKRGIPQIFPGLESPVPQEGALNAGAILSESSVSIWYPNGTRKGCRARFSPPPSFCRSTWRVLLLQDLSSPGTHSEQFYPGKNWQGLFFVISVSTEPSSSSGVAREELNLLPGTQPSIN